MTLYPLVYFVLINYDDTISKTLFSYSELRLFIWIVGVLDERSHEFVIWMSLIYKWCHIKIIELTWRKYRSSKIMCELS